MKTSFVFDLKGVLFAADTPIEGSVELFNKLKENGHRVFILSNSTRQSTKEILKQLKEAKLNVEAGELITGCQITVHELKKQNVKRVFCLGTSSLMKELNENGIETVSVGEVNQKAELISLDEKVDAVLVAQDFDFNFVRASVATRYILERKAKFFVVGKDRQFPWKNGQYVPGPFTLAAPAKTASYITPELIGKPNLKTIEEILPFKKGENVVFIGDNQETDICLANQLGFKSVLMLTGVTDEHEITKENAPTIVCKDMKELAEKIESL